ncbi:collagen alpha-1(I) chain-like [Motacilla alba alba]|uniref:collagen alpha-1(I) chain-like n=1 Tax=Motacilla alba alba TaxID=1094192 RepID=UPI0018D532A9|nr:collagen alpha-1(I) chain-like [Motacilla alba alba]
MPPAGTGAPARGDPAQPSPARRSSPGRVPRTQPGDPVVTLTRCHRPGGHGVQWGLQRLPGAASSRAGRGPSTPKPPKFPLDLRANGTPQEEQPGRAGPRPPPSFGGLGPHRVSPSPLTPSSPAPAPRGRICVSPPHSGVPNFVPSGLARPPPPMPGVCDPSPLPGAAPAAEEGTRGGLSTPRGLCQDPPKAETSGGAAGPPRESSPVGRGGLRGIPPKPGTVRLPGHPHGRVPPAERHHRAPRKERRGPRGTPSTPESCGGAGAALRPHGRARGWLRAGAPGSAVPRCPPLVCVRVPPGPPVPATSYLPGDGRCRRRHRSPGAPAGSARRSAGRRGGTGTGGTGISVGISCVAMAAVKPPRILCGRAGCSARGAALQHVALTSPCQPRNAGVKRHHQCHQCHHCPQGSGHARAPGSLSWLLAPSHGVTEGPSGTRRGSSGRDSGAGGLRAGGLRAGTPRSPPGQARLSPAPCGRTRGTQRGRARVLSRGCRGDVGGSRLCPPSSPGAPRGRSGRGVGRWQQRLSAAPGCGGSSQSPHLLHPLNPPNPLYPSPPAPPEPPNPLNPLNPLYPSPPAPPEPPNPLNPLNPLYPSPPAPPEPPNPLNPLYPSPPAPPEPPESRTSCTPRTPCTSCTP